MNNISINNLFPNNVSKSNESINVKTLANPETKDEIGKDRLRNLRSEKRKRIICEYEKLFKKCIREIHIANDNDSTNIIYSLPDPILYYTDPYYDNDQCSAYIYNKLIENGLDAKIIDSYQIYISWVDI